MCGCGSVALFYKLDYVMCMYRLSTMKVPQGSVFAQSTSSASKQVLTVSCMYLDRLIHLRDVHACMYE
jgi:hypothetical protein